MQMSEEEKIINITSHNQESGITAHTVNINKSNDFLKNSVPEKTQEKNWFKKIWYDPVGSEIISYIIIGIITFVFAFLGFDKSFNNKEMDKKNMTENKTINVTSINQSGGITAGIVNIGSQQRILDDGAKKELLNLIPIEGKVDIEVINGDSESFGYAEQIKQFLISQKRNIVMDTQTIDSPVFGQKYEKVNDLHRIIIGLKPHQ